MIVSLSYDTETGKLALDRRLEGVTSLSYMKAEGSDTYSLHAVTQDGTVKTFGRAAAGEQDMVVDEALADAISKYLCDED